MRFNGLVAAAAALLLSAGAPAQPAKGPAFSAERFRSHVAYLADDKLEGRGTGERGHEMAAAYVAGQFAALGLKPGAGSDWYQRVPFVEYQLGGGPAVLSIAGRAFSNRSDVAVEASPLAGQTRIEAPVVFAGFGMEAPAAGFDDYQGLDVRGKIVAVLAGTPRGIRSDLAAHLGSPDEKRRLADSKGALGILTILPPSAEARFAAAAARPAEPEVTWVAPGGVPYTASPRLAFSAYLNRQASEALFAGAPKPLQAVFAEAGQGRGGPKGFPLQQTVTIERQNSTRSFSSPNVLAVLPGSDPALTNEYVLLMAHLDHLGVDRAAAGDKISNGAMDNATGVSTLLEVARAMAQGGKRPRRPILFAAVTGEEKGLLGSHYLAKNPVVGSGKVVAVVNLDMPILLYDFVDVIAFGAEHSTLGEVVDRAGARMNVKRVDDPIPNEGLFTRSDHYRFVQEGIPSVFLMTGFANGGERQFKNFLATNYHKPTDDLAQPIDWKAGAKFARINYLIAREIADSDQAPRWYEGSFFGDTYAPGQPRARRTVK